jgi:hypothetical protein
MNVQHTILPDGMDAERLVIIKSCSSLRLTSELEMAAAVAKDSGREFILVLTESCSFDATLSRFVEIADVTVKRTAAS